MSKLNSYRLGNNGFVFAPTLKALSVPEHIRQAEVYIVAGSKKAAAMLYNAMGVGTHARTEDLTVTGSNDLAAILAAGFGQHPGVYITAMQGGNDRIVLRATGDGQVKVAGYLHHDRNTGGVITLTGSTAEDSGTALPPAARAATIRLEGVAAQLAHRLAAGDVLARNNGGTFVIGTSKKGWQTARRPAVTKLIAAQLVDEHIEPANEIVGESITYRLNTDGQAWAAAHPQP